MCLVVLINNKSPYGTGLVWFEVVMPWLGFLIEFNNGRTLREESTVCHTNTSVSAAGQQQRPLKTDTVRPCGRAYISLERTTWPERTASHHHSCSCLISHVLMKFQKILIRYGTPLAAWKLCLETSKAVWTLRFWHPNASDLRWLSRYHYRLLLVGTEKCDSHVHCWHGARCFSSNMQEQQRQS